MNIKNACNKIEHPSTGQLHLAEHWRAFSFATIANGIVGFLFACTGPVAIIIAVATAGGLSEADIASWLFAGFAIGGLITILFSLLYRQPLSFAWSIPGTVLIGPALEHLSFAEVIGAYIVTGALMALLALTGWVKKVMDIVPMPIVMGMVSGVFLSFALGIITALEQQIMIALPMVIAYLLAASFPVLERVLPPVVAALLAGTTAVIFTETLLDTGPVPQLLNLPQLYLPVFSLQALAELVIPLAIAVLVVQNGQGFAVLRAADHAPPINAMTLACGIGSIIFAAFGAVCTCVTGPVNAVLVSSGERQHQYSGALVFGIAGIVFGLLATGATWLALKLPTAFIATLGGLAVLKVLQNAFVTAFSGRFSLSAMVTFLVTISELTLWNIGAPFWGLVFGLIVSHLLERNL